MERYRPVKNPPPTIAFQKSACKAWKRRADGRTRVELVKCDAELAQAGEELRFGLAVDGVVDALVRRRLDVPVRAADAHHLGDFPPVSISYG